MPVAVIMDTNVLIAGLRSRQGASHRFLSLIGTGAFEIHLSVPLVLEYESVAKRHAEEMGLSESDIDDVIDYLCKIGIAHQIHFLWRPVLRDPGDDMILELAVAAECPLIVSHNVRDFGPAVQFGVRALTLWQFLRIEGLIP